VKTQDTKTLFQIHQGDARDINKIVKNKIVDVTITSPPYFDLKDYGHRQQIGYGQEYKQYLKDLTAVFKKVHKCTKDTGTLWVIIDAFRKNNEVVPLPFDFSNAITAVGWKLQDVIIWAKDRTVPWAHKGQMRNLFEYILVFSKNDQYNFYVDDVRDFKELKKWWVKYPERYNPKGKMPGGLWHFSIPTQGSWGNGYIKHFCPLPEALIEQILTLTTKEGDIVLDPFAGSGAVLAKADRMKRKYIGIELNSAYIKMFKNYLTKTTNSNESKGLTTENKSISQSDFENLNLNLRALKFAKLLYTKLPAEQKKGVVKIFVDRTKEKATKKNARSVVDYTFYTSSTLQEEKLTKKITELINKPPLSKFGVDSRFKFEKNIDKFLAPINGSFVYTYTEKISHKYKNRIKGFELAKTGKSEVLLSKIKVDLDEKDYE
jgi:DNA modification methylase